MIHFLGVNNFLFLVPYTTEIFSIKYIETAEICAFCCICLLNVGVDEI